MNPAVRFMSRLLIQRDASGTQEIVLKPGANRLGRSEQNDLPINDPTWQVMRLLARLGMIEIATPQRAVYPQMREAAA